MCFSDEGKYFVDGKEIQINYVKDLELNIAKKLEQNTVNQLDAYYIRKNLASVSLALNELQKKMEIEIAGLKLKTKEADKILESLKREQAICKEEVPTISENAVHRVVNGKFEKIAQSLKEIVDNQKNVASDLANYKQVQLSQYDQIIEKINYTIDRTIFGWSRKQFDNHPFRTIFFTMIVSVFAFLFLMATFHVSSFGQVFQGLLNWFK